MPLWHFLAQQNSVRDALIASLNLNIFARHADRVRMANIARMVNILQAMILTDKAKMLLTPTYHVFKMYVPFQDATFVPVTFDAGTYKHGEITLPCVDALAARDASGTLWLALTNLDPAKSAEISATVSGMTARTATGETFTSPAVDGVNTFDAPATVSPKPVSAMVKGDRLTVTLAPKSVTVLAVRPSRGRLIGVEFLPARLAGSSRKGRETCMEGSRGMVRRPERPHRG